MTRSLRLLSTATLNEEDVSRSVRATFHTILDDIKPSADDDEAAHAPLAPPIPPRRPHCACLLLLSLLLLLLLLLLTYALFGVLFLLLSPLRVSLRTLRTTTLCGATRLPGTQAPHMLRSELLAELPLALLSLGLHRLGVSVMRLLLLLLAGKRMAERGWRPGYSMETVNSPIQLFANLVMAPRWNTATLMGQAPLLAVQRTLELNASDANASADLWTAVAYEGDATAFVAGGGYGSSGRRQLAAAAPPEWVRFDLPKPALLKLAVRYYGTGGHASFPALRVDGEAAVAAADAAYSPDELYAALGRKAAPFFYALAWHVYPLLCFAAALPPAFVRRIFLPVGNPETGFRYGVVYRGSCLRLQVSDDLWRVAYLVHLTVYTRASLPCHWVTLPTGASAYDTPPLHEDGFYLVRVIFNSKQAPDGDKAALASARRVEARSNPTAGGPQVREDELAITPVLPVDQALTRAQMRSTLLVTSRRDVDIATPLV